MIVSLQISFVLTYTNLSSFVIACELSECRECNWLIFVRLRLKIFALSHTSVAPTQIDSRNKIL